MPRALTTLRGTASLLIALAGSGETRSVREAVQMSSGGVSLGAYQGGYLMAHDWLRSPARPSRGELFALSKSIQVGASAGAINTLAGIDGFFQRSVPDTLDLARSPYRHWMSIGIGELARYRCPTDSDGCSENDSTRENASSLFFRSTIRRRIDTVVAGLLDTAGKRDDTAWLGFALTRARPVRIPLFASDSSATTQSQQVEIGLSLALRAGTWTLCEQPMAPGEQPHWFAATRRAPGSAASCTSDKDAIRRILSDLVLASSAFPLAFSTFRAASMRESDGSIPVFSDGGIFSNEPLQIGWKLARLAYPEDTSAIVKARLRCPRPGTAAAATYDRLSRELDSLVPCPSARNLRPDPACETRRNALRGLLAEQRDSARSDAVRLAGGCAELLSQASASGAELATQLSKLLALRSAVGESLSVDTFVTVYVKPGNYNRAYHAADAPSTADEPSGAGWMHLAGPLLGSARNQELARFASTDRGWRNYSRYGAVNHTRTVPAAAHLFAFASFLARDLRQFDMSLGMADACLDAQERDGLDGRGNVPSATCDRLREALRASIRPGAPPSATDTLLQHLDAILRHYQAPSSDGAVAYVPFERLRAEPPSGLLPGDPDHPRNRRGSAAWARRDEWTDTVSRSGAILAAVLAGQGRSEREKDFGRVRATLRSARATRDVDRAIATNLDVVYERVLGFVGSNQRHSDNLHAAARYAMERQIARTVLPAPLLGSAGRGLGVGLHLQLDGPPMPFVDWIPNTFGGRRFALGVREQPWSYFPGRTGRDYWRHEFLATDVFGSARFFYGFFRASAGSTSVLRTREFDGKWVFLQRPFLEGTLIDKLSVGARFHLIEDDRPSEGYMNLTWLL